MAAEQAEPAETFTKSHVRRGSAWMLLGQIGTNAIRFGSNLILVRIFAGSASFGQQALIAACLQLVELIADIGVWVAIAQHPRGAEPAFLNTAWTVQVIRGAGLALITCAVAPFFAQFYENPELTPLICLASTGMLVGGFMSCRWLLARRRMAVRELVRMDLTCQVIGVGATIGLSYVWPTTTSLVLGALTGTAARVAASHRLPGPRDRFRWSKEALGAISSVGVWTLLNTVLSHLAMQDRLVFGKLVDDADLGIYHIGSTIALVPSGVVASMAWSMLLPLASSHVRSGVDTSGKVLRSRWPLLLLGGWSLSGMCAGGPLITSVLYPDSYDSAGVMLRWAAVSLWLGVVLEQTRAAIFASMARLRWTSLGSVVKLISVFVLVPMGFERGGFPGGIVAFVLAEIPRLLFTWWISHRSGVAGVQQDLRSCGIFGLAATAGWLTERWLGQLGAHSAIGMVGVFVVVSLIWLPVGWPQVRRFLDRS